MIIIIIIIIFVVVVCDVNVAIVGEVDLTRFGVGRIGVAPKEAGGLTAVASRGDFPVFVCVGCKTMILEIVPSSATGNERSSRTRFRGRCEGQWLVTLFHFMNRDVWSSSSVVVVVGVSCGSGVDEDVAISWERARCRGTLELRWRSGSTGVGKMTCREVDGSSGEGGRGSDDVLSHRGSSVAMKR